MILPTIALLLTATLFGGMILYSFGFAPMMFHVLSPDAAGKMLRRAFPFYYLFIIAGGLASAVVLIPVDAFAAMLVVHVAAIGVFTRQFLMHWINRARDASATRAFQAMHGASVALNFVQLALIGWALVRLAGI